MNTYTPKETADSAGIFWMMPETTQPVRDIVNHYYQSFHRSMRLEFTYGDTETGKAWEDRHESGYVGRSTGTMKIPLVIHNSRSYGGGALMTDSIIRIRTAVGKHILYQHPIYQDA